MMPDPRSLIDDGLAFLKTRRPLAAWASWQAALRAEPGNAEALEALHRLENAPNLPPQATTAYRFRPPDPEHRAAWDDRLRSGDLEDLGGAIDAFHDLATVDPEDSPALFNLALALAWSGRNREAIEALDGAVSLDAETRPDDAVDAWTLAGLLRQGAGAEELADDLGHTLFLEFPDDLGDPAQFLRAIAELIELPSPAEGVRFFEWLDRPVPHPSDDLTLDDLPLVRASIFIMGGSLRINSPVPWNPAAPHQALETVEAEVFDAASPRSIPFQRQSAPLSLPLLDGAVFRFRLADHLDDTTRHRLTREAVERYFEHYWIATPLASLDGRSPIGAMAEPTAVDRCKVAAAIRFREGLAARPTVATLYEGYPFDRLRRRLGLAPLDPESIDPADVTCMGIAELEALDPASLDEATLGDAFLSAEAFPGSPAARKFADAIEDRDGGSRRIADSRFQIPDRRELPRSSS